MQLGPLQMSKKLLQCLRKKRRIYLPNVYVFYACGCKNTLAVTSILHCWSLKKKTQREEWDFECSWVRPYHGTGVWHWHGPAAQSLSCQCHNPAATSEGYCAVVTISSSSLLRLDTHSPVLPPPPGTTPAWEKFLLRLALTGTSMLPEFMALYTLYAYSSTRGAGWLCWGRNASPTPQKKPSVFSPVPSPDGHPSPWPTMVKQAAFREENHKEPFHMIFCFSRIWAWGFPKHTHEDLWIGLLTKYIIMAKLKCNWFKFFDARSEKQEVAEKIFSSKEINTNHNNSAVSF